MKLYKRPTTRNEADANLKEWQEEHQRASKAVVDAKSALQRCETDLANASTHRRYAEDDQAELVNSPFAGDSHAQEIARQNVEKV